MLKHFLDLNVILIQPHLLIQTRNARFITTAFCKELLHFEVKIYLTVSIFKKEIMSSIPI